MTERFLFCLYDSGNELCYNVLVYFYYFKKRYDKTKGLATWLFT